MSSAKQFEKTFSRKKDNKITDKDEDDSERIICSLPADTKIPNPNPNLKNVATSSSNLKQKQPKQKNSETQKRKSKAENSEGEPEGVKKKKKKKKNTRIQEVKKEESSECMFPVNRIVRIIKSEGSGYRLSQETTFLINKATEKFIEMFSEEAYDCAVEERKSFIAYKHLSKAIGQEKRFEFLSDFVPDKITAEKALAERKSTET